jgi:hypothetical protein
LFHLNQKKSGEQRLHAPLVKSGAAKSGSSQVKALALGMNPLACHDIGPEYAVYVIANAAKSLPNRPFGTLPNLDGLPICPYTSAAPQEWTSF